MKIGFRFRLHEVEIEKKKFFIVCYVKTNKHSVWVEIFFLLSSSRSSESAQNELSPTPNTSSHDKNDMNENEFWLFRHPFRMGTEEKKKIQPTFLLNVEYWWCEWCCADTGNESRKNDVVENQRNYKNKQYTHFDFTSQHEWFFLMEKSQVWSSKKRGKKDCSRWWFSFSMLLRPFANSRKCLVRSSMEWVQQIEAPDGLFTTLLCH